MGNQKSADDKLRSYRSDKNKQLNPNLWAGRGSGLTPKGTNSNNQFR